MRSRRPKQMGFSLIETMISVVIIGLCVLGVIGGINFCIATFQANREWNRSADILLAESEKLSLLRWDAIEAGAFPTQFVARLYPEWKTGQTNQVAEVTTNGIASVSTETNRVSTVYEPNTTFIGTIEIKPFLGTNDVGYNSGLKLAHLSVYWESKGRLRTNSLEMNLAQNGIASFAESPVKQVPSDITWTNALEILSERKEPEQ